MSRTSVSFVSLMALCVVALAVAGCDTAAAPTPVAPSATGNGSPASLAARERAVARVWNEAVPRPDGTQFKLGDYAGKVVLVDFWATWCPPCREQAPQLAKISQSFGDQGVEVVGLSVNEKKDEAEVLEFVKQAGMTYTVGYAGDRISAAFLSGTEDETGLPPIPQLFIFGKDGRLVEHLVGYNERHGLPFLERVVAEQLAR